MKHVKIGKWFGIEVDLHYSWFIIFFILAYALAADFFPHYYPDMSKLEYYFIGGVSSLMLFVSVLLHELSHSIIAKKNNIGVEKITLFFFGGVASIHEKNLTPKKELVTALAGPLFSVFLGGIFYLIFISSTFVYLTAVTHYLFRINLILAIFNMVPGYPLDGGRVLRAIIWMFNKNIRKATWYAANMGKGFAIFLISLGVLSTFFGNFGGLWLIFLGFFLLFIAELSYNQILVKETLSKVKVRELMRKQFVKLSGKETVKELIDKYFLKFGIKNFPVISRGKFVGIVDFKKLKKVPTQSYNKIKVKDMLLSARRIKHVTKDTNVYDVLIEMSRNNIEIFPVVEKGKLTGVVDKNRLLNYVNLKMRFSQKF